MRRMHGCGRGTTGGEEIVSRRGESLSAPPELHARSVQANASASSRGDGGPVGNRCRLPACSSQSWACLSSERELSNDPFIAELVDQHVIALSSLNPVDVISEDRHTVKPWFQGKLPFTFNLPELGGSGFTLIGGKVVYLQQNPAAEVLYQSGRHKISVFVLQEGSAARGQGARASFNVKSWGRERAAVFPRDGRKRCGVREAGDDVARREPSLTGLSWRLS